MKKITSILSVISIVSLSLIMVYFYYDTIKGYPKAMALTDIQFVYKTIKENHPGYKDAYNPNFKKNLISNYEKYRNKILDSEDRFKDILSSFLKSFDDSHLGILFRKNTMPIKQNIQNENFEIKDISLDTVWITLPKFTNKNENSKKQFNLIVEKIKNIQHKKYIIFDLRSNTGGNSFLGSKLLKSLYGNDYYYQQQSINEKNVFVEWRVSKDNLEHIKNLYDRKKTANDDNTKWLKKVYYGIKEAMNKKQPFFKELPPNYQMQAKKILSNPIKAKIIAIIDNKCVSACLDFIDELKILDENTTLIGETTNKDSNYMEIRDVKLPSNKALLFLPIKVYRNRPRKNNEPYTPDIFIKDVSNKSKKQLLNQVIFKISHRYT